MKYQQNLQDHYKTCPKCGQTLPIACFVVDDRGDEHRPLLSSLCADCRQTSLDENTRRDYHEQLDLDHRDLWLRQWRQKKEDQQRQDQAADEQAREDDEQALDDDSLHDSDKKDSSRKRDKERAKNKSFLNNPLFYETTDYVDPSAFKQAHSQDSNDPTRDPHTLAEHDIDYDYNFLSHYSPDRLSFKNRQLDIAKTGINLSYIDPEILTRLFYENPFYERLRDFIDSTAGMENTTPFALSRVRAIHLGAPITYAISSPNFYAMQTNLPSSALYNATHNLAADQNQATHSVSQTAKSGLFASGVQNNATTNQQPPKTSNPYTANNLFQDNQQTQQQDESDELTQYIRKTWGKR